MIWWIVAVTIRIFTCSLMMLNSSDTLGVVGVAGVLVADAPGWKISKKWLGHSRGPQPKKIIPPRKRIILCVHCTKRYDFLPNFPMDESDPTPKFIWTPKQCKNVNHCIQRKPYKNYDCSAVCLRLVWLILTK